jgi:hypothetical protein
MRLFKRKILLPINRGQDDKPSLNDKAAKRIAGFFIKMQLKFCDGMNKAVSGISTRKLKVLLVIFCLLSGGLSIYFIAFAVFGSKQQPIKIDHVKILKHIDQHEDEKNENSIDVEIYRQIQDYKRYMDSTKQLIRPGFLDSMKVLEQIYLSQQKNEAYEKSK